MATFTSDYEGPSFSSLGIDENGRVRYAWDISTLRRYTPEQLAIFESTNRNEWKSLPFYKGNNKISTPPEMSIFGSTIPSPVDAYSESNSINRVPNQTYGRVFPYPYVPMFMSPYQPTNYAPFNPWFGYSRGSMRSLGPWGVSGQLPFGYGMFMPPFMSRPPYPPSSSSVFGLSLK